MSSEKTELSVVIPAYNCEAYIGDCVDAILRYPGEAMEVIVVDDGSTDGTPGILDSLAAKDPRVRVIHKENGGVSSARNRGLDEARGTYVMFSDSDDTLRGEKFADLLAYEREADAEIVVFGYAYAGLGSGEQVFPSTRLYRLDDPAQAGRAMTDLFLNPGYCDAVWNKLFRRSLLEENRLRFEDYRLVNSEDQLLNIAAYAKARSVASYAEILYDYYVRPGSLSRDKTYPDTAEQNFRSYEKICAALEGSSFGPELMRYYLIRMVNNVAVQSVTFNRQGFFPFRRTVRDLKARLLAECRIHARTETAWLSRLYPDGAPRKYRLLDRLVFGRGSLLLSVFLFAYSKYVYKVEEHY